MERSRVLIHYQPQLYAELLTKIFQSIDSVDIYDPNSTKSNSHNARTSSEYVDVIVFSLDVGGHPEHGSFPEWFHTVKLLAFSPHGDVGYKRLPGEDIWERIHPFGMEQIIHEVAGSHFPQEKLD
jgi:hypothetical protein